MSECRHGSIVTYMLDAADTAPIWACADCMLRFYPACRTCVDVGHRSGVHQADDAEIARLRAEIARLRSILALHNKTPTGRTRKCLPGCIACAALDSLPLDVAASAPETPDLSTNGR